LFFIPICAASDSGGMEFVMYQGKRFLAIIPARGGSKGLPRKNIRHLAGKPLIAWTIEEAKKSHYLDRCIVSTEDKEIKKIAEEQGGEVPFIRPMEYAQDDTASIKVLLHAICKLPGYDFVVLLQPTSPLRTADDIDSTIKLCVDNGVASCVSITEVEYYPYWMYMLDSRKVMHPLIEIPAEESYQRQKLPKVYRLNGAVYVNEIDTLLRNHCMVEQDTIGYVMPQDRSYDIDTLLDFEIAEMMMRKLLINESKE